VGSKKFTGSFSGRFTSGKVAFTVNGNQMRGTMNGTITWQPKQYWQSKQYPFNSSFQGIVSPKGEISGLLSGKVQGVTIFGALSGKIQGNAASGRWDAQALMADDGNWQAKGSGQ
jgi:hypothetical protein